MRFRHRLLISLAAAVWAEALAGCGGPAPAAVPPAASVSLAAAPAAITLGQSASLSWSSANATACAASGAWTGSQALSGTVSETPAVVGAFTYTLGCTGAGAAASASAALTVAAPPLPTLTLAFDASTIAPGGTAHLVWSSANATTCVASGAWTGPQPISGSLAVTQPTGGYSYVLACTGPGGAASASAFLLATNLLPSSYQNKNDLDNPPAALPSPGGNTFALADFFQDGTRSLVLHTLVYNANDPSTYTDWGQIYFYRMVAGAWVDSTAQILSDQNGCLHPRKAVIADFNLDGRPDVFFACQGLDASPFPGEQPHLLLSQPDGTYQNITLPITCYCHGASAADINGDGLPDILVTDTSVSHTPFFLINQGNGAFTPDFTRLPANLLNKAIFSAELVDFAGRGLYDVFLGGNDPGTTVDPASDYGSWILPNDGHGAFLATTPVNLLAQGGEFGLGLDINFLNGYIYLLQVNQAYSANQILKIAYPALTQSVLFTHSGNYPNGNAWVDWILPYLGQIDSANANFALSIAQ